MRQDTEFRKQSNIGGEVRDGHFIGRRFGLLLKGGSILYIVV